MLCSRNNFLPAGRRLSDPDRKKENSPFDYFNDPAGRCTPPPRSRSNRFPRGVIPPRLGQLRPERTTMVPLVFLEESLLAQFLKQQSRLNRERKSLRSSGISNLSNDSKLKESIYIYLFDSNLNNVASKEKWRSMRISWRIEIVYFIINALMFYPRSAYLFYGEKHTF